MLTKNQLFKTFQGLLQSFAFEMLLSSVALFAQVDHQIEQPYEECFFYLNRNCWCKLDISLCNLAYLPKTCMNTIPVYAEEANPVRKFPFTPTLVVGLQGLGPQKTIIFQPLLKSITIILCLSLVNVHSLQAISHPLCFQPFKPFLVYFP